MKKLLFIAAIISLSGCARKEESKVPDVKPDTIQKPMAGADEDAHGCITSAGYTWSVLRGECVRIFEAGTRLDPVDNKNGAVMSAFVIFKGDEAEIFIQTEKPFVAKWKSEDNQFVYGKWQLIPSKGFVLKKDGKILYTRQ